MSFTLPPPPPPLSQPPCQVHEWRALGVDPRRREGWVFCRICVKIKKVSLL